MLVTALVGVTAALGAGGCAASRHAPLPYPGAPRPAASERTVTPAVPLAGAEIASLALSFRGTPYANGGTEPGGFDCSGLVQYVFARAGLALPRSVREQVESGVGVEGEVQAGDLVFFAIDGETVSHVGIATGSESFVHAPSTRGVVREERLDAPYWARRLAAVRRIAGVR
jgi:cell wall-associated NlpC family hydrolase